MENLMDTFVNAAPGTVFRVEEKSGSVSFVYEGELKSVDVAKRVISLLVRSFKTTTYTISVDNILRINGDEPWVGYSTVSAPAEAENMIFWAEDDGEWINSYENVLGRAKETVFSRVPERTVLELPAFFCGTQQPQQGWLVIVDYIRRLVVIDGVTLPGVKIKVPTDKVASIDNGVIKPVA